MKYILLFLLSFNAFAQDTITAESTLKVNPDNARIVVRVENIPDVVYRGIINKINVVVAGVPDWDVACSTTSGSFTKAAGAGQYLWNVTTIEGKMASLAIVARMPNGERKMEKKEFEIKEMPVEPNDLPRPIIYNPAYETIYRGSYNNRLKISVPGAKSFTATAPGLQKIGNKDDYTLRIPQDNKENRIFIDFEIVTKTDSVITYKQMFIPKDISIKILINGQGCEKCIVQQTLAELKNAEISVEMPDIRLFNTTIVRSFKVILPDGGEIQVKGNRVSTEALYFIEFLKPGEMIIIDNIYYSVPGVQFYGQKRYPIKIMLIQ